MAPLFWWDSPPGAQWTADVGVLNAEIPYVLDLVGLDVSQAQRDAFEAQQFLSNMIHAFVLPSATPPDVVLAWRDLFQQIVLDPKFDRQLEDIGLGDFIGYADAASIVDVFAAIEGLTSDGISLMRAIEPRS